MQVPVVTRIYGLFDPRDGQLKYIGKTKGTLHGRLSGHINEVARGRTYLPRQKWLEGLLASNLKPEIELLEEVTVDWQSAEQFWISYFRSIGASLMNATGGGEGTEGFRHTEETILKISASARARYKKPGEREKTGSAVRKALAQPEAKARLSKAASNRSPEARKKLSESRKAFLAKNPDMAQMLGNMNRGKPKSAAIRLAISRASMGKKVTPETAAKIAAAHRGMKRSAATRAKISAGAKRRYSKTVEATIGET